MRHLSRLAVVLVMAIVTSVVVAQEDAPPAPESVGVEDLAWMSGTWRAEGSFEEHWTAPLSGTMVAVSRQFAGDQTPMVELSEIAKHGDRLVLRLRHFHPGLVPWEQEKDGPIVWRLEEASEHRVKFTDPARDFPRSIVYSRDGDVLTARLIGEREGKPVGMEFELQRVR